MTDDDEWKIEKEGAYEEYWVTRDHYTVGPAKIVYDLKDAMLIAAAKDMLKALQLLCDAADDSDGCQYGTLSTSFVRSIVRPAIEKAGLQ